jgi:hypothetical protein
VRNNHGLDHFLYKEAVSMHIRDEDLELYLLERLEQAQTQALESHLAGCGVCAAKLSSVAFFDHVVQLSEKQAFSAREDKRREPRTATDDPGVLQRIVPFSPDRLLIRIIDVSKGGMQVSAPVSLERGTMIKVLLKGLIAFGEVRHCRAVGASYRAGIQLYDALQA